MSAGSSPWPRHRPLRVLHVTSTLNPGGVETWLLRLARHQATPCLPGTVRQRGDDVAPDSIKCPLVAAILVLGDSDGSLAPEFRRLGVTVMRLPPRRGLASYMMIRRLIRETGPWDVVHSHAFRHSLLVQLAALHSSASLRITHSHHVESLPPIVGSALRRLFRNGVGWLLRQLSHEVVACSRCAAESLFGNGAGHHFPVTLLPCGVSELCFGPLASAGEAAAARSREGIPGDALVLGHVGRFVAEKGHHRLLHAAARALQLHPKLHFLLVGDGPLRPGMEALALSLGIHRRVQFTGTRSDVPRLLRSVMDGFVFPSLREGLGVAVVEAQAAGLPCLLSSAIPAEANLFPQCNRVFPNDADASVLANELVAFSHAVSRRTQLGHPYSLAAFPARFRLSHNVQVLSALYQRANLSIQSRGEVQRHGQPA